MRTRRIVLHPQTREKLKRVARRCRDADIVAGAYDFADFNTTSATTEANRFLAVAGSYVREG